MADQVSEPGNPANLSGTDVMISRYEQSYGFTQDRDFVAHEAPLEIRLTPETSLRPEASTPLTITMRTPGEDLDLIVGFLFAESLIHQFKDIKTYKFCGRPAASDPDPVAILCIDSPQARSELRPRRNFISHGGCGLCGKASLDSLDTKSLNKIFSSKLPAPIDLARMIPRILSKLKLKQALFQLTGGLHASAIFNRDGDLLCLKEDIGRHNALDKAIGWMLAHHPDQLSNSILILSGRVSWELMQKAARAQIPCVLAIGAPSSLAIDMAKRFNICLTGFVKDRKFNLYHNNGYIQE